MSEIKGGLPNSGSNVIDCKNVECINNKCTKGDGCATNISCTDLFRAFEYPISKLIIDKYEVILANKNIEL